VAYSRLESGRITAGYINLYRGGAGYINLLPLFILSWSEPARIILSGYNIGHKRLICCIDAQTVWVRFGDARGMERKLPQKKKKEITCQPQAFLAHSRSNGRSLPSSACCYIGRLKGATGLDWSVCRTPSLWLYAYELSDQNRTLNTMKMARYSNFVQLAGRFNTNYGITRQAGGASVVE
jgi:hypothetical protein